MLLREHADNDRQIIYFAATTNLLADGRVWNSLRARVSPFQMATVSRLQAIIRTKIACVSTSHLSQWSLSGFATLRPVCKRRSMSSDRRTCESPRWPALFGRVKGKCPNRRASGEKIVQESSKIHPAGILRTKNFEILH